MVEYTSRPIIVSYMITIGSTTSEELRSQIIAILKMHEKVKVIYITPTNSVKSTWRYNMIKYTSLLMIAWKQNPQIKFWSFNEICLLIENSFISYLLVPNLELSWSYGSWRGSHECDRMVVRFTTTYAIRAYHH